MKYKLDSYGDIFQSENYLKSEIKRVGKGEAFQYIDEENGDYLFNTAIKREIPERYQLLKGQKLYDLESPYGYGGFRTNISCKLKLNRFVNRYKDYCLSENIIAEFYRNNPLNNFCNENPDIYDFRCLDRKTVLLDLSCYEDLKSNYSSSLKRNIKKAGKNCLDFQVIDKSNIKRFIELYDMTMKKNEASEFYFFPTEYFEQLVSTNDCELLSITHNNEIINMALMLVSNGSVYYHLGASHPEHYSLNGNPLLFDRAAERYSSLGYKFLYMGGGSTREEDDPLLRFKKKFSSLTRDFLISGIVFDKNKYMSIKAQWESDQGSRQYKKMFLQYRA